MARTIKVEIVGDASSLERAFGRAASSGDKFRAGLDTASRVAGGALLGIGAAAKVGFDELSDSARVAAQTAAVLKSTGGGANVTAKQVSDLANQLLNLSGVDDEAIQKGENLLLTFRDVRNETGKGNDVFTQATKAALDMSVALGTDMSDSALQLGKALNDPARGMTRLQRVGVSFTEAQIEQVKALEKSGHTLEAQKVILGEVTKEFGGSAKAAGDTFAGGLSRAREQMRNTSAELVSALIPSFESLAHGVEAASQFMSEHQKLTQAVVVTIAGLSGAVLAVRAGMAVYTAATTIATAAQAAFNAVMLANPIVLVTAAIVALVAAVVIAYKTSDTFRGIVQAAFHAVETAAVTLKNTAVAAFELIGGTATRIGHAITGAFDAVLGFVRGHWPVIATLISGPMFPLVALATDAFGIRSHMVAAFGAIKGAVVDRVGEVVATMRALPGRIVAALGNLGSLLVDAGRAVISGLISGIESMLGDLKSKVGSIGGLIKSLKGPLPKDLVLLQPEGEAIMLGLISGMQRRLPQLAAFTSGIGPGIAAAFPAPSVAPASRSSFGGGVSGGALAAGGQTIVFQQGAFQVAGSVISKDELVNEVLRGLQRVQARSGNRSILTGK